MRKYTSKFSLILCISWWRFKICFNKCMQKILLIEMGTYKWHLHFHCCLEMIFIEKWIWYSVFRMQDFGFVV